MPQAFDPLGCQIDHIIAIQHSGPTVESNLALACYACNRHKGRTLRASTLKRCEPFRYSILAAMCGRNISDGTAQS
jgi:5-methylcytosine-specific restriction endonuclease McrA